MLKFIEQTFKGGHRVDQNKDKITQREQQALETRNKIIKAAIKNFSKYGFHGTSIRDINQSIDTAQGLIYHYFPGGKDELFKVISEESFEMIAKEVEDRKKSYASMQLIDILEDIFNQVTEVFEGHFNELKILIFELWKHKDVTQCNMNEIISESLGWFPKLLKEKINQGEINSIDVELESYILKSILVNHFLSRMVDLKMGYLDDSNHRKNIFQRLINSWKG